MSLLILEPFELFWWLRGGELVTLSISADSVYAFLQSESIINLAPDVNKRSVSEELSAKTRVPSNNLTLSGYNVMAGRMDSIYELKKLSFKSEFQNCYTVHSVCLSIQQKKSVDK